LEFTPIKPLGGLVGICLGAFPLKRNKMLNKEQVNELLARRDELMALNPSWRKGQSLFNALAEMHPSLAGDVRGTINDPFYTDRRCDSLINHISE